MMLSSNFYRRESATKRYVRLKNVIITMEWCPGSSTNSSIASFARQISGGFSKNGSVKSRMNQDQERQLRRSLELFDDDGSGM